MQSWNVGNSQSSAAFLFFANKNPILNYIRSRQAKYEKYFFKPIRIMQAILIILYLGVSVILFFQLKLSTSSNNKFVRIVSSLFLQNERQVVSEIPLYIYMILGFSSGLMMSLPLNFKIVIDLITHMQANYAEWDYKMAPANLRINKSQSMKALGNITNVFMSKNAIMSMNIKKSKVLQIGDKWYFDFDLSEEAEAAEE